MRSRGKRSSVIRKPKGKTTVIRIDEEVRRKLKALAIPLEDTANDVLRKLLELKDNRR
jgi:hypothetical protein